MQWSPPSTLLSILTAREDDDLRECFIQFLKSTLCYENFDFWIDVEKYKAFASKASIQERKAAALAIWEKYIDTSNSASPTGGKEGTLNINRSVVKRLHSNLFPEQHSELPDAHAFDEAQKEIFTLMRDDSFNKFLQSKFFANYQQHKQKKTTATSWTTLDFVAYSCFAMVVALWWQYTTPDAKIRSFIVAMLFAMIETTFRAFKKPGVVRSYLFFLMVELTINDLH